MPQLGDGVQQVGHGQGVGGEQVAAVVVRLLGRTMTLALAACTALPAVASDTATLVD